METNLAQNLVEEMEEPSGMAGREDGQPDTLKDAGGNPFDESLYETDKEGKPVLTKAGMFRKKRGGGAVKSTLGKPLVKAGPQDEPQADKSELHQIVGASYAELIFTAGIAIGGEDWEPEAHERTFMTNAWAKYCESKDMDDLPPGVLIATALCMYALPRLRKPETKKRLSAIGAAIKDGVKRITSRRRG